MIIPVIGQTSVLRLFNGLLNANGLLSVLTVIDESEDFFLIVPLRQSSPVRATWATSMLTIIFYILVNCLEVFMESILYI